MSGYVSVIENTAIYPPENAMLVIYSPRKYGIPGQIIPPQSRRFTPTIRKNKRH